MRTLSVATIGIIMAAVARAEWLGLGVMLGEPSGLSAKTWLDKTHAVDAGMAWSLSGDKDFQIHGDYLFHNYTLLADSGVKGRLAFYYGVGGRISMREGSGDKGKDRVGVRIPLGLSWTPPDTPLDVFLEVVPIVDLLPDTEANVNGALGLRYWFK